MNKINDIFTTGIMFEEFRHHEISNGKPTLKLLRLTGEHILLDAYLFYPIRNGIVITEYQKGYMIGYCVLEIKNGEIIDVPKTPYLTLKKVKNKVCLPQNIFDEYVLKLIGTGHETWSTWKTYINNINLLDSKDYTFMTLTTKQDRIPNVGMIIEYPGGNK